MLDTPEWTECQLLHEVISNLESLQGSWVEWRTFEQQGVTEWLISVTNSAGQIFRLQVVPVNNEDSAAFDELFVLI